MRGVSAWKADGYVDTHEKAEEEKRICTVTIMEVSTHQSSYDETVLEFVIYEGRLLSTTDEVRKDAFS